MVFAFPNTGSAKPASASKAAAEERWFKTAPRIPSWIAYSEEYDVLVSTNKSGIDTWYGIDGEIKWSRDANGVGFRRHPENYYGRVILWKDQAIKQLIKGHSPAPAIRQNCWHGGARLRAR
jgi:hypothetical protein